MFYLLNGSGVTVLVDDETGAFRQMLYEPKKDRSSKARSKPAAVVAAASAASATAKPLAKPKSKAKTATRAVGSKRRSTGFKAVADEVAAIQARERDDQEAAAGAADDDALEVPEGGYDEDAMSKELDVDDSDQVPDATADSTGATRLPITSHLQMLRFIAKTVCKSHKLPLVPIFTEEQEPESQQPEAEAPAPGPEDGVDSVVSLAKIIKGGEDDKNKKLSVSLHSFMRSHPDVKHEYVPLTHAAIANATARLGQETADIGRLAGAGRRIADLKGGDAKALEVQPTYNWRVLL